MIFIGSYITKKKDNLQFRDNTKFSELTKKGMSGNEYREFMLELDLKR